jgi:hypothetical protein
MVGRKVAGRVTGEKIRVAALRGILYDPSDVCSQHLATGPDIRRGRIMTASVVRTCQLLGRNASAFVAAWIVGLVLVQFGERQLGGWPASETGQLIACAVGVPIAIAFGARVAMYFWAAMTAFSLSELAIHGYYGIRSAQGAPTHFAVMGGSLVAVFLGAALSVIPRRHTGR